MASTDAHDVAGKRPWALGAAALFVLVMVVSTLQFASGARFPFRGGDEQGHFSYVAHLAKTGEAWPDVAAMPLYDLTGAVAATPNFINHPPTFYLASLPAYRAISALGADPAWLRAVSMAFGFAAFATIAALGLALGFGPLSFLVLTAGMQFLLVPTFAAFYGNDQVTLLGGALACLGALRRLRSRDDRAGLVMLLAGVALCSAKLTAFLLVGAFAVFALASAPRIDRRGLAALGVVGALAAAPFVAFWVQHGSPAPATPGHVAMMIDTLAEFGLDESPRLGLFDYLATAPRMFAAQLGPGVGPMLILAAMAATSIIAFGAARDENERIGPTLLRAAVLATLLMLAIHLAFAYRRHAALGWLGDLYPRYYYPLLAAYGIGWTLFVRRLRLQAFVLWTRAVSAIRPSILRNPRA